MSFLLSEWKPLWRDHDFATRMPTCTSKDADGRQQTHETRLAAGQKRESRGGRPSLIEMVREMLTSAADAGVDIQVKPHVLYAAEIHSHQVLCAPARVEPGCQVRMSATPHQHRQIFYVGANTTSYFPSQWRQIIFRSLCSMCTLFDKGNTGGITTPLPVARQYLVIT